MNFDLKDEQQRGSDRARKFTTYLFALACHAKERHAQIEIGSRRHFGQLRQLAPELSGELGGRGPHPLTVGVVGDAGRRRRAMPGRARNRPVQRTHARAR